MEHGEGSYSHLPSWRNFPMRRFFSLTSFSSSWVLDELLEESSKASLKGGQIYFREKIGPESPRRSTLDA